MGVRADDFLCESLARSRASFVREATELLADCSHRELKILTGTMRALKEALRRSEEPGLD